MIIGNISHKKIHNKSGKTDIVILGATGSIGKFTLDVIRQHKDHFNVIGITGGSNYEHLISIAKEFNVKNVAIGATHHYKTVKESLPDSCNVLDGYEGIIEVASLNSDVTVAAISGIAGLEATVHAIKSSKRVALANKEALICGGKILKLIALEYETEIIPVDSEHNSAYQIIASETPYTIKKLTLTASGGPFIDYPHDKLRDVTKQQAIKHPNWMMGAKISVDSATLANKGLEIIEAYHLFGLKADKLGAVIHRASIVHSIAEFIDGSTTMNLYNPSMVVPISYAIGANHRLGIKHANFDFINNSDKLKFEEINLNQFPAFAIALTVTEMEDQSRMIAYNAANEFAVEAFLQDRIKFTDISKIILEQMSNFVEQDITTTHDVIAVDKEVKLKCNEFIGGISA